MTTDPRILSPEYLDRLGVGVEAGICASSSEQEIDRMANLLGHIAAQDAEIKRLTGSLASCDRTWSEVAATQADRIAQLERAMPRETSASIAAWQNATFGPATTTFDRVARSSRLIFAAMARASGADLSVPRPNLSRAIRAAEELAELIEMLVADDGDPHAPVESVDIGVVLEGIIAAHGQDRACLEDAKMSVNRARTWAVTGDGHGQHVAGEASDNGA